MKTAGAIPGGSSFGSRPLLDWPRQSPLDVALRGACPRCGKGRLFRGPLKVVDTCAVCGLDLRGNDAGDGPTVFVILGLGALMVGLVLWFEFRFDPPVWLHVILWVPITIGLAVGLLRLLKGLLVAQQYIHRSTELEREEGER